MVPDRGRQSRRYEPELEPESEPEDTGVPTRVTAMEEEPYPAPAGAGLAACADDEDEEEPWEEPFSLLENIVRERFKTPIQTEPYAAVEVIRYADNEILDLLRANPGDTLRVGADRFELIKLESGRALLYFNREFSGTLVSKGKARPLKAFCTDNYLVDDDLYGVVMQEGDYAQVLRGGTGYLVRFIRPPLMPTPRVGIGLTLGGVQAFAASLAVHFLLLVLLAVLVPETVLPVEGDSERFAKVSLKDLDLEKAVKEEKVEAKKEEAPPPSKDIPKETPKVVKRVVRERVRAPVQNVPLTTKQKERAQKKAVASVMTALENLKPAAGAGPGRSDLKALASNISAVRSPAGAAASFRVSGVIGRIGGDGVRLVGGFGGGGGKATKDGGQLLAGGSRIGRLDAVAGTGTKVRGRVSKAPSRSVTTSGGQCDRAVIQNVVGANMHAVQACYERVLLTTPGLSGKVVFDWTIAMGGGVSSARMVSSSMASPAVATCILALIRTWRFSPCPIGGPVEVRYPFVFRVSGF
jgi:TonB family protein